MTDQEQTGEWNRRLVRFKTPPSFLDDFLALRKELGVVTGKD